MRVPMGCIDVCVKNLSQQTILMCLDRSQTSCLRNSPDEPEPSSPAPIRSAPRSHASIWSVSSALSLPDLLQPPLRCGLFRIASRSRTAASSHALIASEGSPRRSSVSLSFGSESRLHPGYLDVDVACGFATGWRSHQGTGACHACPACPEFSRRERDRREQSPRDALLLPAHATIGRKFIPSHSSMEAPLTAVHDWSISE